MTTEEDKTPADRPVPPAAAAAGTTTPATSSPVIPAPTSTPAPTETEAEAPKEVTLDHLVAMHRRILALQADQVATAESLAAHEKQLKASHDWIVATLDQWGPKLADLMAAVNDQGDVIEDVLRRIGIVAAAQTPPARGEIARRMPSAAAGSTRGAPALEGGGTTGAPLAPGETRATDLLVDPQQLGTQIHTLPGGQEVEINVRRPPGDRGIVRDGRRVGGGGVRRG